MKNFFSLLKNSLIAVVLSVLFVFVGVTSAQAISGGGVGACNYSNGVVACTCPASNPSSCYLNIYSCKKTNVSNSCTERTIVSNATVTKGSTVSRSAPNCGTLQIDMGNTNTLSAGWIWADMDCSEPAPYCPYVGEKAGNITYRDQCLGTECDLGTFSASCGRRVCASAGNVACGQGNCGSKMAVCSQSGNTPGQISCVTNSMCSGGGAPTPTPGTWSSCGTCGSIPGCTSIADEMSANVCQKADGSYNHPISESMTNPSGVCVWNPGECGGGSAPTPDKCAVTISPSKINFTALNETAIVTAYPAIQKGFTHYIEFVQTGNNFSVNPTQINYPSASGYKTTVRALKTGTGTITAKVYMNNADGQKYVACQASMKLELPANKCGNGKVETGETCDLGSQNGHPNSMCDAFCNTKQPNVCSSACSNDAQCNENVVELVNKTTGKYFFVDGFAESGTTYKESDKRLFYKGTWVTAASVSHLDGAAAYTKTANDSVSFMTASSSAEIIVMKRVDGGDVDVLVNGVKKSTFSTYRATSGYKQRVVIDIFPKEEYANRSSKYVCYAPSSGVGTQSITSAVGVSTNTLAQADPAFSGICRLAGNPTSTSCSMTPPTPTPAPLVCDLNVRWSSTGNPDKWKYGDMVTFTVDPVPASRIPAGGSVRYEGEVMPYRGNARVKTITLEPLNATASQFKPFKVDEPGAKYYFRFRYCVKTAAGVETCSAWGNPQVPTGATPAPTAAPTAAPESRTIKLVKDTNVNTYLDFDAIVENGVTTESSNSRFALTGSWTTGTNALFSAGSTRYSKSAGASVTFTTSASTLKMLTTRANNRGTFTVYVNGTSKGTINTNNATAEYKYEIDLTPYLTQ